MVSQSQLLITKDSSVIKQMTEQCTYCRIKIHGPIKYLYLVLVQSVVEENASHLELLAS